MSRTIDYHRESKDPSIYKYSVVNPQNGQNTVNLVDTAQREVVFELPSQALNLHRTYLNLEYNMPAQGNAASFAWLWRDLLTLVESMRLRTSSNIELMRLEYVRMYTKLLKKDIKIEDYITFTDEEFPYPVRGETANGENKYINNGVITNDLQPTYIMSADGNHAANAGRPIRLRFNLGRLIGTIFEVDKTLYFPESIFLHITFGPWTNIGFFAGGLGSGATATIPGPAAPANPGPEFLQEELHSQTLTLRNVHLAVALETNPEIVALVMNTVNSTGLSVPISTTVGFMNNPAGAMQTVSIRLSAGSGQKLRRIYHTCQRQSYAANPVQRFNISNQTYNKANNTWAPDNISRYYVMLDNTRISGAFDIDCANGDDWLVNRKHLKGSIIQTRQDYVKEWHHQEDFSGIREDPQDEIDGVLKTNISDGLDLVTKERKIDIVMHMGTNGAANHTVSEVRNHYTFCEIERTLHISSNAIGLDIMGAAHVAVVA